MPEIKVGSWLVAKAILADHVNLWDDPGFIIIGESEDEWFIFDLYNSREDNFGKSDLKRQMSNEPRNGFPYWVVFV